MKKVDIAAGIYYVEVPEEDLRILCGCPENSIKFVMKKGLIRKGKEGFIGPNALLLNDIAIEQGRHLNLAEFPFLHYTFFQGTGDPNNREKMVLIGLPSQIENQFNYVKRGYFGLYTQEEISECGISPEEAEKLYNLRKVYHQQKKNFDIITPVYTNAKIRRVKGDLYIRRNGINDFTFIYKKEKVHISLKDTVRNTGLPYELDYVYTEKHDFSIITTGNGNGWNPKVPCMGGVICYKGSYYLMDAGPGMTDLLKFMGISINEIDGVFSSHSHDDHFSGLISLFNSQRRVKYYSTPLIKNSVFKKMSALLNTSEEEILNYFDFIPLEENSWNDIEGLHVKPSYSLHPVETNIFYFKAKNREGKWLTYGHLADIISRRELENLIDSDKDEILSRQWLWDLYNRYFEPVDLKKIDAGGGVVHGESEDFLEDRSQKIVLSHLNRDISQEESSRFIKPMDFGYTDVLISASRDYDYDTAESVLKELTNNGELIKELLCCPLEKLSPGTVLYEVNERLDNIYLVLSGEITELGMKGHHRPVVQGDFTTAFYSEDITPYRYKSLGYCTVLKIPSALFKRLRKEIQPTEEFYLLRNENIFHNGFSVSVLKELSSKMKIKKLSGGDSLSLDKNEFFIIKEGGIEILCKGKEAEVLSEKKLCGYFLFNSQDVELKAVEDSEIGVFSTEDVKNINAVTWKLTEVALKRAYTSGLKSR